MNDVFHKTYRELSPADITEIAEIKEKAAALWRLLEIRCPSEAMSHAKTNLQQSVMWAVNDITK